MEVYLKMKNVVTVLKEMNIPKCKSCGKTYEMKSTTVNKETQQCVGQFLPSCKCEVKEDGEIID